MTVRVPIAADAQPTLQAIREIRDAIHQVGQEGVSVANVDLSKMGAGELASDLERVLENLKNLTKVGVGPTAAAARKAFGNDPGLDALLDIQEHAARLFPDAAGRDRFVRNVTSYVASGTSFDPNRAVPGGGGGPGPGPSPPPAPPSPPKKFNLAEGDGLLDMVMKGIAGGAGFALAQMGLSSIGSAAGMALHAGEAENSGVDRLMRLTGDLGSSFDKVRKQADLFHDGLLVTRIDFERYAGAFAAANGNATAYQAMQAARIGVGVANGFGSDPGSMMRGMGQASFLGVDPARFAEMVGESAVRGAMGGKIDDVMASLLRATESLSRVSGTRGELAGQLGGFDDLWTAMQASGSPALRGQNADAAIGAINSSITAGGGGGLAGQVLTQRAMMRAGLKDPYDIQMQLAGGAFARVGGDKGPTNYDVILDELKKEYGGLDPSGNRAAIAAGNLFGLNPRVAKQLLDLKEKHVDLGHLDDILKPYGGINGINPTGLKNIIEAENADDNTLRVMRKHALETPGNSPENQKALRDAKGRDQIREALIRNAATQGMIATPASEATAASNRLTDAMTTLGGALVPAMTALKDKTAELIAALQPFAEYVREHTQRGPTEIPDNPPGPNQDYSFTPGAKWNPDGSVDIGKPGAARPSNPRLQWLANPQHITAESGILSRIGQQESGLGSNPKAGRADGTYPIFGEIPTTWVEDVRGAAKNDPALAKRIEGMSDADIRGLETLNNAALQTEAANYHWSQRPAWARKSDMAGYAWWNFGLKGQALMEAPSNARLSSVLGYEDPLLPNATAGSWRDARRGLFSDGAPSGSPSSTQHHVTVTPGAPIKVVVQNGKSQKDTFHDIDWNAALAPAGVPAPHGIPNASNGY